MLTVQAARGVHSLGGAFARLPQNECGQASLTLPRRVGPETPVDIGFSSRFGRDSCSHCEGLSLGRGIPSNSRRSSFLGLTVDSRTVSQTRSRRHRVLEAAASEGSSTNGSVTTSTSTESRTTQVEVEESNGAPASNGNARTPILTRSSSRGADADEKFAHQLKRVAEAANLNGRVGYVSRSALRLRETLEEEEEESVTSAAKILSDPEIVLRKEEISKLTGKTKKGIKKGLKKLVERSASTHGHHNAAKLVTTDWTDKATRSSARRRLMIEEAWTLLRGSVVKYQGEPVGTVAAADPSVEAVNYDQVFIRDFVPSALAFLMEGEHEIVKNFLLQTLQLQSWDKTMDCFSPGEGLMPASFKVQVRMCSDGNEHERLDADFGESAIGRVAPVDSGLWWIILLRAYLKVTKDGAVQTSPAVQKGIRLVLKLILRDGFDMFPTLLVPDGSCMIDRRMGVDGHPLEIQSLYYSALRCAREMLTPQDNQQLLSAITARLSALSFHIRQYYWLDFERLNEIYRYQTEEYSEDAANKFNVYPESLPPWVMDWMPEKGGYFIGGVAPGHLDFRVFTLGNCWAILSSLATPEQTGAILDLYEQKWVDLVADMPLKICYPAMVGEEWRIVTGCDPKNTAWSYHNGGSWPTLLWHFTAACIKGGRPELATRALDQAEKKLAQMKWPEYTDGVKGNYVGKQARKFQTWTIAGFLVARRLLEEPSLVDLFACDEDKSIVAACSVERPEAWGFDSD